MLLVFAFSWNCLGFVAGKISFGFVAFRFPFYKLSLPTISSSEPNLPSILIAYEPVCVQDLFLQRSSEEKRAKKVITISV